MREIELADVQGEAPPAPLNDQERKALILARARLRAMIERRSHKLNQIAGELADLRDEMRTLDAVTERLTQDLPF